jgi:glycosyltransferase involved in cell wall biosynthesis
MGRPPLSVAIITYNEEDIIGRTLEAVKDIASEIVVVDSHSTDRTREIAESYGAKVFLEDWKGYVAQKNSALSKCTQEWILCLDADEIVSEELKESIVRELENPRADGYMVNRRLFYMGKLLKHTFQPEWRLRLVRRSADPRWTGKDPHDRLTVRGRIGYLKGDLLHFSYKDLEDHLLKLTRMSRISSMKVRKVSAWDLILRPTWSFLKTLFIKKAILDGKEGLIVAVSSFIYTFCKYAFAYESKLKAKT